MPITATTLSAAVLASDTFITVASATGITAPNFQTAAGITFLMIDQERLLVMGVNGTQIAVLRAQGGTQAVAHVSGQRVAIGLPTDFPIYQESLASEQLSQVTLGARVQNAIALTGSADAVLSSVPGFYVIKTAGVDAITIPTPVAGDEGNVIEIWSDTAQAHTVTAASACLAAGVALKTIATFPAFRGAGVTLRVCNLVYHLIGSGGTGTNSGPVVLT